MTLLCSRVPTNHSKALQPPTAVFSIEEGRHTCQLASEQAGYDDDHCLKARRGFRNQFSFLGSFSAVSFSPPRPAAIIYTDARCFALPLRETAGRTNISLWSPPTKTLPTRMVEMRTSIHHEGRFARH